MIVKDVFVIDIESLDWSHRLSLILSSNSVSRLEPVQKLIDSKTIKLGPFFAWSKVPEQVNVYDKFRNFENSANTQELVLIIRHFKILPIVGVSFIYHLNAVENRYVLYETF